MVSSVVNDARFAVKLAKQEILDIFGNFTQDLTEQEKARVEQLTKVIDHYEPKTEQRSHVLVNKNGERLSIFGRVPIFKSKDSAESYAKTIDWLDFDDKLTAVPSDLPSNV